jgi:4'-phosphopantetheinyl transferase
MVSGRGKGDVSIWFGRTDQVELDEPTLDVWLTAAEQERAARFAFAHLRRRYRIGRAVLRRILAGRVGVPARDVVLSAREFGKPFLPGGPYFNMSSSGELLMIGVSDTLEFGVDIEQVRVVEDYAALVRRHFSQAEIRQLEGLPDGLQMRAFLRGWSRKEAVAKAVGDGLHLDFSSYSVPLDSLQACSPVTVSAAFPHGKGWFVRPIGLAEEAEAAISANAPVEVGTLYRIGPDLSWVEEAPQG